MSFAVTVEDLLRACTVRIEGGPKPGAGFFVAPGVVITCAHVAGAAPGLLRVACRGREQFARASAIRTLEGRGHAIANLPEYPDVAVLDVEVADHPCVGLDQDLPGSGDVFQVYGFPEEGGSVSLTAAALSYRGVLGEEPMEYVDLMSDTVKRGMSGAALLKVDSSGVCGIVVATRAAAAPDGGLAVAWAAVREELHDVFEANRAFHDRDSRWRAAAARPAGRPVRFGLPPLTRYFRGRSVELELLRRSLADDSRAVVTQVISGLGGVGQEPARRAICP